MEQLLASSNMPKPHSRLSASLQTTGQLHCGEQRQEFKVPNFMHNLFDLILLPNTHTICYLAQKAPREHGSGWFHHGDMEWVAGEGWTVGTLEVECRSECHSVPST